MPTMDLAAIPSGTRVFLDTNIFYLHYRSQSVSCTALLNRIAQGDLKGYVNTQALSDLLHKLMLAEAVRKGYCDFGAHHLKRWLSANRHMARTLTDCQSEFEHTLELGLKVMRISKKLLVDSKEERAAHGLMTGDSLHLGNMNRHAPVIRDIATYDGDFTHIASLTVWKPMDVIS